MSMSQGTGQPHFLKCSKCRSTLRNKRSTRNGTNLVATGKTSDVYGRAASTGGSRVMRMRVQYRCLDCGHIGWSRHVDAGRLLRNLLSKLQESGARV